jgi:DNA-binding IclR family transcriptional regulator
MTDSFENAVRIDVADGEDEAREPTQRRVGSVRDAIAILRHLERIGGGEGVNRIARSLDLSPSSCFNLLKTLVAEQFVDFDDATKLYSLGPGAIALGRRALDPAGAFELFRPRLEALADKHSVTAGLLRLRRGEQLILVGLAESPAAYRIHMSPGQRLPAATGAGGRCVMAFSHLDEASVRRRFDAVKWADPPPFETYIAEVEAARVDGWAIDEGHFLTGVTTIAAPCLNASGAPEYVVTATLFTGQHPQERLLAIAEEVRAQADWLATRLFKVGRG